MLYVVTLFWSCCFRNTGNLWQNRRPTSLWYSEAFERMWQSSLRCSLPGMVPRLELSKNCLGQFRDSVSELPPTSKNLLLGDSRREAFGESSSFLGDSKPFLGVSRSFLAGIKNFLGELSRLEESEVMGKPLLVGVLGDWSLSSSTLFLTFSLMALFFHLVISACWLATTLMRKEVCD